MHRPPGIRTFFRVYKGLLYCQVHNMIYIKIVVQLIILIYIDTLLPRIEFTND